MKDFEPLVVGFVCYECVYAAADLAGTSRLCYPPNIRLIRVPCSGQVDMVHVLRAFENGADCVFVGGCLKEQCHYVDGNAKAEARVKFLKKILTAIGIEEERLSMQFMSAAMGSEFVRVAQSITDTAERLGPNPLKNTKPSILDSDNKRENLKAILHSILGGLGKKPKDFTETIKGFGDPEIDEKKCLGCGACAYVCLNEAMNTEVGGGKVRLVHDYWRCTACGNCIDVCPMECMDVADTFDLLRFLSGEEKIKAEMGALFCQRCGNSFLPVLLEKEVRKVLDDETIGESYLELCPSCRRIEWAERIKASHGYRGEWKRVNTKGRSTAYHCMGIP